MPTIAPAILINKYILFLLSLAYPIFSKPTCPYFKSHLPIPHHNIHTPLALHCPLIHSHNNPNPYLATSESVQQRGKHLRKEIIQTRKVMKKVKTPSFSVLIQSSFSKHLIFGY